MTGLMNPFIPVLIIGSVYDVAIPVFREMGLGIN
jgi:hypothetical protein